MSDEKEILELIVDREYKHGFNSGYLLAKHAPEKLKELLKESKKETAYVCGIRAGQKQVEKEKILQQLKYAKDKSKDKDREI